MKNERRLKRCKNCGRRIFKRELGKYEHVKWVHYGYALDTCDGMTLKYAEPEGEK